MVVVGVHPNKQLVVNNVVGGEGGGGGGGGGELCAEDVRRPDVVIYDRLN